MGLITNQVKEENNETEFQCRQECCFNILKQLQGRAADNISALYFIQKI